MIFEYGTLWSHSHCHLSFLFKWKTKSNESAVPLKAPKESGPRDHPFLWLNYGTRWEEGISLCFSREAAACRLWLVIWVSEWPLRNPCETSPPSMYPWEIRRGLEIPAISPWRLLLSILSSCTIKLEWLGETCVTQTLHLWQKTPYSSHPPILHSSSQKFAIILTRHFQTRLTQLWFSVGWDYFVLFCLFHFFKLNWPFSFNPRLVYTHTYCRSLFPCLFFLFSSWILDPTHQPMPACPSSIVSTLLHGTLLSPSGCLDFDLLPSFQLF